MKIQKKKKIKRFKKKTRIYKKTKRREDQLDIYILEIY